MGQGEAQASCHRWRWWAGPLGSANRASATHSWGASVRVPTQQGCLKAQGVCALALHSASWAPGPSPQPFSCSAWLLKAYKAVRAGGRELRLGLGGLGITPGQCWGSECVRVLGGSGIDAWVLLPLHLWGLHPESAPPCSPGLPPLSPGLGKGKWSLLDWGQGRGPSLSPRGLGDL